MANDWPDRARSFEQQLLLGWLFYVPGLFDLSVYWFLLPLVLFEVVFNVCCICEAPCNLWTTLPWSAIWKIRCWHQWRGSWFISSPSLLCLDIPPLFCGVHQGSILDLLLYRPPLGQIKLISFIATEITHVACMSLSSLLNRCIMYYALSR